MYLLEPDVALTDLALALEACAFAYLVRRPGPKRFLSKATLSLFASLALTSVLGAIAHGLFPPDTVANDRVWRATLAALGITAFSEWLITADLLAPRWRRLVGSLAAAELFLYVVGVAFFNPDFRLAILNYAIPTALLLVAFVRELLRSRSAPIGCGVAGGVLTFAAAWIQQKEIGIHPLYFNHNALYHAVQGVALALLFIALRSLARSQPESVALR